MAAVARGGLGRVLPYSLTAIKMLLILSHDNLQNIQMGWPRAMADSPGSLALKFSGVGNWVDFKRESKLITREWDTSQLQNNFSFSPQTEKKLEKQIHFLAWRFYCMQQHSFYSRKNLLKVGTRAPLQFSWNYRSQQWKLKDPSITSTSDRSFAEMSTSSIYFTRAECKEHAAYQAVQPSSQEVHSTHLHGGHLGNVDRGSQVQVEQVTQQVALRWDDLWLLQVCCGCCPHRAVSCISAAGRKDKKSDVKSPLVSDFQHGESTSRGGLTRKASYRMILAIHLTAAMYKMCYSKLLFSTSSPWAQRPATHCAWVSVQKREFKCEMLPTCRTPDLSKIMSLMYYTHYSTENNYFPTQKKPTEMIFSPVGLENYM